MNILKRLTMLADAVASAASAGAAPKDGLRGVASFNDSCGTSDKQIFFLPALIGVILEPLVKAGITAVGAALQKAGAPDEATVTTHVSAMFYRNGSQKTEPDIKLLVQRSCLMVAFGAGAGEGPLNASTMTPNGVTFLTDSAKFSGAPSLLLTGSVQVSSDRTAWRIVPQTVYVGSPLTTGGTFKRSGRDLVLTIIIRGAGAKPDDAVIATRLLNLDRSFLSRASGPVDEADREMLATTWIPLPAPSEGVSGRISSATKRKSDRDALELAKVGYDTQRSDASSSASARQEAGRKAATASTQISEINRFIDAEAQSLNLVVPVTFEFSLHETRDGNKFIADVGKLLSDNAAAFAKPIADQLSPAAREDAKVAAGEAEDKLHVAAFTAVGAWQDSKAKGEDSYKVSAARQAAIGACRTLGLRGFADPVCLEVN